MPQLLKKLNFVKISIALALIITCAVTALLVFSYGSFQRISVTSSAKPTPTPVATPEPWIDEFNQLKPYSLLMLGYGGGGHEGGKLSDSMIVINIIPKEKKIFLISIPRDMWVALPTTGEKNTYWKVNAAYAIGSDDRTYSKKPLQYTGKAGGGEMAKFAAATITGIPIDNFAALDFAGFKKAVDVVKGVDVKVAKTFDDPLYPIEDKRDDPCGRTPEDIAAITATMSASKIEKEKMFPCRYEDLHFDAGTITMDGETALKYVRSRHSPQDGGDFNRSARQRSLLLAMKNKVFTVSFFPKIIPFISTLSYNLQTDVGLEKMEEFITYKDDLSTYEILGITPTDKDILIQTRSSNGQDVLMPKAGEDRWDSVQTWLQEQMKSTE